MGHAPRKATYFHRSYLLGSRGSFVGVCVEASKAFKNIFWKWGCVGVSLHRSSGFLSHSPFERKENRRTQRLLAYPRAIEVKHWKRPTILISIDVEEVIRTIGRSDCVGVDRGRGGKI